MKWASTTLGVIGVVILVVVALQGRLGAGFKPSWTSGLQIMSVLAVAVLIKGFMEVLMLTGWVARRMRDAADSPGLGIAWLAGALTSGRGVIGNSVAGGLLLTGSSQAMVVTYVASMATMKLLRLSLEVGFDDPSAGSQF